MSTLSQTAENRKSQGADLLALALAHARHHIRVHPLHSLLPDGACSCSGGVDCPWKGKHPRLKGFHRCASTDPARITQWWTRWPHANIGGIIPPWLIVLDTDPRNGGDFSREQLQDQHGVLPRTLTTVTPGRDDGPRGTHEWFVLPRGVRLTVSCTTRGEGLELLSYPRNIVLAGSVGANGSCYEFELSSDYADIAPAPEWLLEWLLARLPTTPRPHTHTQHSHLSRRYFLPPIIPDGQRNDALYRLYWSRFGHGDAHETRTAILHDVNAERCDPPLPDTEVDALARKAEQHVQKVMQQTANQPRTDPRPRDPHLDATLDRLTAAVFQRRGQGRGAKRAILLEFYKLARKRGRLEDLTISLRSLGSRAALSTAGSRLDRIGCLVRELCQEGFLVRQEIGRAIFDPNEQKFLHRASTYAISLTLSIHTHTSPFPEPAESRLSKAGGE